jgi:hypothetical protein
MKFNPLTKRLYTDDKFLLKQLHCPYWISWDGLRATDEQGVRLCKVCERKITDTAGLRDEEVLSILERDPEACLRVSLNQENLRVIHADEQR